MKPAGNVPVPRIGSELARGGEGTIHVIPSDPDSVAKIWHDRDVRKAVKVEAMIGHPAADVLRTFATWPTEIVRDRLDEVAGFAMRRIDGHQGIHRLYTPKNRRHSFPAARWNFLARVASNVARAFAGVHAEGVVIGDVNHSSVLVGPRATVVLVDCDSFQVEAGGRTFTCDVGVDAYTPPELQGVPLTGLRRTASHDEFGLAVLVFQLLMLGRHPFSGVFSGRGEMTVERAIAESRYAYAPDGAARQMKPPPGSPPIESLGNILPEMFRAAFTSPTRPSASDWVSALSAFEAALVRCDEDPEHHRLPDAPCPFCAVESLTGRPTFGEERNLEPVVMPDARPLFERLDRLPGYEAAELIERTLEKVTKGKDPRPSRISRIKGIGVRAMDRAVNPARIVTILYMVTVGLPSVTRGFLPGIVEAILVLWLLFSLRKITSRAGTRIARSETDEAREASERLTESIRSNFPARGYPYVKAVKAARHLGKKIEELDEERSRTVAAHAPDVGAYLDRHKIAQANLKDLGETRISSLRHEGIVTAHDVTKRALKGVPGIGAVLSRRLLDWRAELERVYRSQSLASPMRARLRAVDLRVAAVKTHFMEDMEARVRDAESMARRILEVETAVAASVESEANRYAAARANLSAATGK